MVPASDTTTVVATQTLCVLVFSVTTNPIDTFQFLTSKYFTFLAVLSNYFLTGYYGLLQTFQKL